MSVPIYLVFSVLFTAAQVVNHIDDTDETYGYYEPLHYLLYGRGMQTWEYGPDFAIRSYAFLMPFAAISSVFKMLGLNKLVVFFLLRAILGQISAASLVRFLGSVKTAFGERVYNYMLVVSLCCPGLFYCSTSFLPSALACSVVMLASADYLDGNHARTVFWGCVAVLWTGWPFVGVVFLPMGLHILFSRSAKSVGSVVQIVIQGALVLLLVAGAVVAVDSYMYGKRTFPPLNILLYNALSGNGDELYGVEPASYYIKNLLLTLGLSLPLAVVGVLVVAYRCVAVPNAVVYRSEEVILMLSAVAWIGVLMSRPHKEERFMYPVYPLVLLLAAQALRFCEALVLYVINVTPSVHFDRALLKKDDSTLPPTPKLEKGIKRILLLACLALWGLTAVGRISALYNNYSGYIKLWMETSKYIERTTTTTTTVCMGSDWYTFPSHFFLPASSRLEYFRDGFGGILPQHFAAEGGTRRAPLQPFNGLNREETSRYVPLDSCDYVVRLMSSDAEREAVAAANRQEQEKQQAYIWTRDGSTFEKVLSHRIIDSSRSSPLTRAFALPGIRERNEYFEYALLKNTKK